MKKILFILFLLVSLLNGHATEPVSVMISDGINNKVLSSKMESNLSALLTEINNASNTGRPLNYNGLHVPNDVRESLNMLWDNSPFMVTDELIVEHGLTTHTGYQIRNIPLMMLPKAGSGYTEDEYQEAVVSFDKNGNITNFNLSISWNIIGPILKKGKDISDIRRRELILDYVEQFRTSYNQKDIHFLEDVFSDDALIVTGKVVNRKSRDGMRLPPIIEYNKQGKKEYLTNLKRVFASNKSIKVTFDEIEVIRHPANENYYGVTLHQGYSSDRYHDDGYVFLFWDFKDEEHPEIHVRTWQPDQFNGARLPKDEIFNLNDFDI